MLYTMCVVLIVNFKFISCAEKYIGAGIHPKILLIFLTIMRNNAYCFRNGAFVYVPEVSLVYKVINDM